MTQLPSLERWALLPFWGFPILTCFLNLYNIFVVSVGTFSGSFLFSFNFYVPYFGLACDHGNENSFLSLEEQEKEGTG